MLFVVVFHISEILSEPLVVQGIDHQYICFFYTVCQQHNAPPSPVQNSTRNSFHRNDPFLLKLPFPIREVVKEQEWIMAGGVRGWSWEGVRISINICFLFVFFYLYLGGTCICRNWRTGCGIREKMFGKTRCSSIAQNFIISIIQHEYHTSPPGERKVGLGVSNSEMVGRRRWVNVWENEPYYAKMEMRQGVELQNAGS